jgi:hypothetical protein
MLWNYRVATQPAIYEVVLSSLELVSQLYRQSFGYFVS